MLTTQKLKKYIDFISKHTSDCDYGRKFNGEIKRIIKKEDYLAALKTKDWSKINKRRLSKKTIASAVINKETLYISGNPRKGQKTLIVFDIDCHNIGDLKQALRAFELIRKSDPMWSNLFAIVSTNGNGIHAVFLLDTENFGIKYIKEMLKNLEEYFSKLCQMANILIDAVEIKCTPCEISGFNDNLTLTLGSLVKMPIPASEEEADKIINCPVISASKLSHYGYKNDMLVIERKEKKKQHCFTASAGKQLVTKKQYDSIDNLDNLASDIMAVMASNEIRYKGRHLMSTNSIKDFALVIYTLTKNINDDKSMPVKRIYNCWQSLYESEICKTAPDYSKIRAIRNAMSRLNIINWINSDYSYTTTNDTKGKACKWSLCKAVMEQISNLLDDVKSYSASSFFSWSLTGTYKEETNFKEPKVTSIYLTTPEDISADDLFELFMRNQAA